MSVVARAVFPNGLHPKRSQSTRMRIAALLSASHNRFDHSIAPKGACRCATTILAIKTLATETTAFATGKRNGSNWDAVRVRQLLTMTERIIRLEAVS